MPRAAQSTATFPAAPGGNRLDVIEHAATLSDLTRLKLLYLVERQELSVTELTRSLRLPQSTVSRHLRWLSDGGWLRARRDGTTHYYELRPESLGEARGRLWQLVRGELEAAGLAAEDLARRERVLEERRLRSQEFFATTSARWDRLRDELFGPGFDLPALLGLIDPDLAIGDLACGTGRVAAALGPLVRRVVAIDRSGEMLSEARARLAGQANIEVREGPLEALPLGDRALDAATLFLALHHVADPARALREVARVLRPGGRLLLVDMVPHERQEYREQMGHVWLGFSADQVERFLAAAGFIAIRYRALAADPAAQGPGLFAASARVGP